MENVHILAQRVSTRGDFLPFDTEQFVNTSADPIYKLVEQLQTTLHVDELLTVFAEHAQRIIKLSGLQFHSSLGVAQMYESDNQFTPYKFDLELNEEHLGQLVYYCQYQLSDSIRAKLCRLHSALLYPLRNALTYNRVLKLATKDALTGLNNRSQFTDNLAQRIERGRRLQSKFSLMLLDLDNFKQVNDVHGHSTGDDVLKRFSDILKLSVRSTDTVYRFGGDEFAIIIDDPEFTTNKVIAERIMHAVRTCHILSTYNVTTSIGFTLSNTQDCENSIFSRTDKGLYRAKADGRNCARTI
ncbi:GGDEF domain-containing protein [Pseudoalteromonas sp. JBTF-M23]|uniref:GGDEF domain-containing protein n=1 Tax=Pseudoalteromonas caenipelagi TaxID=2726988 RepID=A0A849VGE2_9GAMM|nr:GGDEF domain-containing protein [Pseudoalteromonas caenipelagi]NOU52799.1 GGDEF domain-containing protein [Pseudoalteromonas caenipelagi]